MLNDPQFYCQRGGVWVNECIIVIHVKGDECKIVPFHSHDLLLNCLYLFIYWVKYYNDLLTCRQVFGL